MDPRDHRRPGRTRPGNCSSPGPSGQFSGCEAPRRLPGASLVADCNGALPFGVVVVMRAGAPPVAGSGGLERSARRLRAKAISALTINRHAIAARVREYPREGLPWTFGTGRRECWWRARRSAKTCATSVAD